MENEHDSTVRSLRQMRELTDDYTTPASASEMLEGLRDLDRDLHEHMYKENAVLFPRALIVQKEAGQSNCSNPRQARR